ncbi:hypothetical protein BU26DRAFT_521521 [Trematosphaeria pertusa]|uniref:Uncharacterized protein n=1 Tax=Trematosphaeria pertusa TaxID=390896 RepID=A0A6A6I6Y9_9PLEO|nr:uncharacterized protein BU26DRAFT_521521 [Trematosphaeria pertusa]KAF2245999.1 hypothetical protein BU26DRAFT_521521 [Trematosphaeria pertusa]
MDHWGDPWADDADEKTPPKQEVTTPPPPTLAPAPVILNGFLDDAQWGSIEDEGFGAWARSPRKPGSGNVAHSETRGDAFASSATWDRVPDVAQDVSEEHGGREPDRGSNEWSAVDTSPETHREQDNVVSETSDSGTTIQPDDAPARSATDFADSLHPDDDHSTRPSTSPSDISHNETTTESPRTSFEDERAAEKARTIDEASIKEGEVKAVEEGEEPVVEPSPAASEEADDEFGDFEEDGVQGPAASQLQVESIQQPLASPRWGPEEDPASGISDSEPKQKWIASVPPPVSGGYSLDLELLAQLFPPAKQRKEFEDAPHDPVHSTSARKAWYRLTRRQTMREFNSGNDDDNYIRVTWKTSNIRSEVNKVVSRWANEDRIAGRGPGARASFYWDSPAPVDPRAPNAHLRKKSSIAVSKSIRSAKQNLQPLSTDVPAAFNWSSPSAANLPSPRDTPGLRSTSSPLTGKHSAISKLQRQEGRAVSVDLTPRPRASATHKRTATSTDFLTELTSTLSPPASEPIKPAGHVDPWAQLGTLDTNPSSKPEPANAVDDDDDWGEMVESPAVSTVQTPIATLSEPSTRANTLSTPSTTPKSVRSSPLQPLPLPSGSKHASPIVRLKGTVSPTSALFKANAFVPASIEEGPIGPGILKARNKSTESTPEKPRAQPQPTMGIEEVLQAEHSNPAAQIKSPPESPITQTSAPLATGATEDDAFSAFETSLPPPAPIEPSTLAPAPPSSPPPPPAPTDAPLFTCPPEPDFSIFESSLPTTTTPAPSPQRQTDPSDPWSIFESTNPPSALPAEPEPAPFARAPPRPMTPPAKQPLTSATSSAQRRKAEEDEIIRAIVEALPDLGYMLRR